MTALNAYILLDDDHRVGPGFWTENEEHTASAGQGDSGGPTAVLNGSDTTKVLARGMISVISPSALGPCTGFDTSGRQCGWWAFHIDIDDAPGGLGLTINTN
ncbi:hypothetical protein AB0I60_19075 [Actinosynnema sp. NPDC050436]|uniref:hypothetical protein n=1 Tax=Actinosynnema sp. NPDC050436 TaxID=3155659 RepID=UPI0033D9EE63